MAHHSVGRPIHVERNESPTKEEVEAYQKKYIDELMKYVDIFLLAISHIFISGLRYVT